MGQSEILICRYGWEGIRPAEKNLLILFGTKIQKHYLLNHVWFDLPTHQSLQEMLQCTSTDHPIAFWHVF